MRQMQESHRALTKVGIRRRTVLLNGRPLLLQRANFNGILFEIQRVLQTFGQLCTRERITTLREVDVLEMLSHSVFGTQSFDVGVFDEKAIGLGLIHKMLWEQIGFANSVSSRNRCLAGDCLLPNPPECRKLTFRNQTIMSKQSDAFG
jgi:hypothetical protein